VNLRNRLLITASLWLLGAAYVAQAQQGGDTAAASSAPVATKSITAATTSGDMEEVVVNGIKRGDLIMPTRPMVWTSG
jgi:hypothetical protein